MDPTSRLTDINLQHLPELSVRHLPDLSDASFELPEAADDNLLASNGMDFLKGADVSFTTPPRSQALHETMTISQLTPGPPHPSLLHDPLTLSELTPKPKSRVAAPSPPPARNFDSRSGIDGIANLPARDLRPRVQATGGRQVDRKLGPAPGGGVPPEPQGSQRFESLKSEVKALDANSEGSSKAAIFINRAPSQTSDVESKIKQKLRVRNKTKPKSKPVSVISSACRYLSYYSYYLDGSIWRYHETCQT
jgi:hypothetical protein